ncbi:MAG: lysophospholipid acyltransferase family protein [Thermodesulfobacteriota bacterium]
MKAFYRRWFAGRWPVWAAAFLKFWSRTVRTRIVGLARTQEHPRVAYAHWHGDELALLPRFGRLHPTVLVSHSRDGEAMARAASYLGYRVARGSSTRGAVGGLVALIKAVKQGHNAVLAVDGPQGPRGVCKPGIVRLAQKTGVPLFPVGVAVSRKYIFKKTWNQVYLPLPCSRQVVFFGPPLSFPPRADDEEMEGFCRLVEEALGRAQEEARHVLEAW